jgi:hypothetical protein
MAKPKKTNRQGAGAEIRGRRPFVASALSGHEGSSGTGRMVPTDAENYRNSDVSYTVKSYDTPIAWHDRRTGWQVPKTKHSSTTSRHQSIVRGALSEFSDGHDNAKEQSLWNQ